MIVTRNHKEALLFGGIVLGLSLFIFWGPIAFLKLRAANLIEGRIYNTPAFILFLLGGFVPSVTGIVLTYFIEGKTGLKNLFRSALNVKIGFSSWLVIFVYPVIIGSLQLLLYRLSGGGPTDFSQIIIQLPTIIPLILLGPLSEEFGWRGFLQKRINATFSPFIGGIIIGLIWSAWHLPLFFMTGTSQHDFNIPYIPFMISVISASFAYSYVYSRSNGSLFAAILLHWTGSYIMQVIASQVSRTQVYNWLECLPALITGFVFVILIQRQR
jgi:membrane protease YdiL (CAAX protease family)